MFTEEMITAAHAKVRSGADYPRLVQDLKDMGVRTYTHNVADGSDEFYGDAGHSVTICHGQAATPIAATSSEPAFKECLSSHQQGKPIIRPSAARLEGQVLPNGRATSAR